MKSIQLLPLLTILLISFAFGATSSGHKGIMNVEAKVIKEPFVNKIGKELDFSEYYIEVKQHTYFIKWNESKVQPSDIEPFLNKKVKLKIEVRNGLWDTDNPNAQSRIGDYAVIIAILDR